MVCGCLALQCWVIRPALQRQGALNFGFESLVFKVKTRPGDLVMPDPFRRLFSQNFDYFRTYKNHVEPGYKGHPIEFMVDF